jgi:hypothetical protein
MPHAPSGFVHLGSSKVAWLSALALLPLAADVSRAQDDPESPAIVATVPAAGAATVSILVEPTVYYDRALDPAAIASDSLILRSGDGAPIDGQVVLGADARSVAFVPARPLEYGSPYALEVAALAAGDGGETVVFTTDANPPRRQLLYWGAYLQGYLQVEIDSLGRVVEVAAVSGPGNDGLWLTGDDRLAAVERRSYDPGGRLQSATHYFDPGADGLWRTADDAVAWRQVWLHDEPGRVLRVTYDGPGPDGTWRAGDDSIESVAVLRLGAGEQPLTEWVYGYPGGDGTWFTADDTLSYVIAYDYDGDTLVGWRRIIGPDARGDWNGPGQRLDYRARRTVDPSGHPDLTIVYTYPGGDGVWGNDDDVIGWVIDDDRSPAGLLQRRVLYSGPGADGMWLTDDDTLLAYVRHDHDDRQLETSVTTFDHPGSDGQWFTADDVPASGSATAFDPLGNRTVRLVLSDLGLDELWDFY